MAQRATIAEWVSPADGSRGLRLAKVRTLLARQGLEVPYSTLHRFAVRYCGFRERQAFPWGGTAGSSRAPSTICRIPLGWHLWK